jgi:hypothetical protein
MQSYIVAFDLKEKIVNDALNWIVKQQEVDLIKIQDANDIAVADVNMVDGWPEPKNNCVLYLIAHGGPKGFAGDIIKADLYTDPGQFLREYSNINEVYKKAVKVVLVSCSTADESNLLVKNGFQSATFAKNLKNHGKEKTVVAAVGPVYKNESGGMSVKIPSGVTGASSIKGWVNVT